MKKKLKFVKKPPMTPLPRPKASDPISVTIQAVTASAEAGAHTGEID